MTRVIEMLHRATVHLQCHSRVISTNMVLNSSSPLHSLRKMTGPARPAAERPQLPTSPSASSFSLALEKEIRLSCSGGPQRRPQPTTATAALLQQQLIVSAWLPASLPCILHYNYSLEHVSI